MKRDSVVGVSDSELRSASGANAVRASWIQEDVSEASRCSRTEYNALSSDVDGLSERAVTFGERDLWHIILDRSLVYKQSRVTSSNSKRITRHCVTRETERGKSLSAWICVQLANTQQGVHNLPARLVLDHDTPTAAPMQNRHRSDLLEAETRAQLTQNGESECR